MTTRTATSCRSESTSTPPPGDAPVSQDICTAFPGEPQVTSGAPWLTLRQFLQRGCNFHNLVIATASADSPEGVLAGEVSIKVNNAGCCVIPTKIPVFFNVTRALLLNFPAQGPSFQLAPKGPRLSQPVSITRRRGPAIGEVRVTTAVEGPVNWLAAEVTSVTPDEARLAVSATAAGLTPAFYRGSVTIQSDAVNAPATLPVELEVVAGSGPVLTYRGAADNSTFDASVPLAPGSVVAAFGQQLLNDAPVTAGANPLPTELGRTRLLVNGTPAPLYYASYNQVNFQVPLSVSGSEILLQPVRDGVAGNTIAVALRPRSPAIPSPRGYGAVTNSDGTQAAPASIPGAHPAARGSAIVIYATSAGATSPLVPAGTPSPAEPLARILVPVKVFFGSAGSTGEVFFAGLSPGSVGLYQVNVWVPESAPTGDRVSIWMSVDGVESNRVPVAVK
ncbi:MAG: hypothetical protein IT161_18035 [Bryobacterales bacterium]|nr:hypothetical protein [Bryobacterales bacterium]